MFFNKNNLKQTFDKILLKIKQHKVIIIILLIFCIGFIYKTKENKINEAIAMSSKENNNKIKTNETKKILINANLYNKTIEEKRKFLLKNYIMDNLLGDKNASVSIIEYSSFTCKYCKKMRPNMNKIIEEYVYNKNIINYALRPLYNTKTLPFGAFIQCAKIENKEKIYDLFFNTNISSIKNIEEFLIKTGKKFDMNEDYVKQCIYNEEIYQKLIYMQQESNTVFDLQATPTILINGKRYDGYKTYEELKEIIEKTIKEINYVK